MVERRKAIEVEEKEVLRKELELKSAVKLPAEAESYRMQQLAEAKRMMTIEAAKADSERIKLVGTAEASAISGVGKADAERMKQKAAVYKQYGEAAIMSIVLEALPKVSAPLNLSHCDYINVFRLQRRFPRRWPRPRRSS